MGAIERKGGTRSEKKGIKVARETGGGGGKESAEGVIGARERGSWEPERGGNGSQRGVMGAR